jgi:hypothetical protein
MQSDKLLKLLFVLIWALALIHIAAEYFYLYWQFHWFDIFTHFLGGLWVGLAALWLWYYSGYIKNNGRFVGKALVVALVAGLTIGFVWELYEFIVWQLSGRGLPPNYISDSLLDLVMDTVGAFVGYLLFSALKKRTLSSTNENTDQ